MVGTKKRINELTPAIFEIGGSASIAIIHQPETF